MSNPCASSDASMPACCLVRMARVMVKMTAWEIVRPRASLLFGHELQRSPTDRGVQRRRAHRRDDEVRLGNRSGHEAGGDAFHIHDDEPAIAVMQFYRLHHGGFGDIREDAHPIGEGALCRPPCEGAVRVAVHHGHGNPGVGHFRAQQYRRRGFASAPLRRDDHNGWHD